MNYTTAVSEWLQRELKQALGADAKVFALASKQEVQGSYVVYDSIEVQREYTKDGSYPVSVTARLLVVDRSLTTAEFLADSVEALLADGYIPNVGDIRVTHRRSDYDSATGEYVEEIRITVEI